MGLRFRRRLAGIALWGLLSVGFASPALAQPPLPSPCPPAPVCPPVRQWCPPQCPTPFIPEPMPAQPGQPTTPTQPLTPTTPSPTAATPSFGELSGGADVGSTVALSPGGYIDNAVPQNMIRSRFDYGFDMNRPDRAEFFYAAWREISFHPHGVLNERGTFQSTNGRGPDPLPGRLDYQEVSTYLEGAITPRLSVSIDVPFRMVQLSNLFHDFEGGFEGDETHEDLERSGTNFGGLSDIVLGVKYAMIADQDQFLTFQFRTFSPSGYARHALGTGHWSIEPGLLYSGRPSDRVSLFGQAKVWIPIDGTHGVDGRDFSAPIAIYGLGVGYDVMNRGGIRITPLTEVVGWTVTNGFETIFSPDHTPLNFNAGENVPEDHGLAKVSTTIVNVKLGVRTAIGDRDDVYVGFGKCVTGDRWYNEIIRVEYRHTW